MKLTYCFLTFNRAERLPRLVEAMRAQSCPIPFEILAINNASTDDTEAVLLKLQQQPGPPLRIVKEATQGIVPARNRALQESMDSDIMVFIDDDELPRPGLLQAVTDAILNEGAECVGGRVKVVFDTHPRPQWLSEELLGFLAEVDHGDEPFWINNTSTPVWTANVGYDMKIFRNYSMLHFDPRYDRQGQAIGGGEDAIMFRRMLEMGIKIRYRPDMMVNHAVEPWRLKRSYFIQLHYKAGQQKGKYELPHYDRIYLGVPPFLIKQFINHLSKTIYKLTTHKSGVIRQAMNTSHALGMILGYMQRQS